MALVKQQQVTLFYLNCLTVTSLLTPIILQRGISPFNPESVALGAGRIMLQRIDELLKQQVDFAIETTLSTRSYVSMIKKVQQDGYNVALLYFGLKSPQMAMQRVALRVSEGGHNIPRDVIIRRY